MPFQIDGRGDMNAFVLTSPLAGVMLLTRRQPFYPSAAHDKFFSICTAFGGYTEFGIVPYEQDKADFDSFAAVIRKYVGITELTPTIVNEFVKKIIVHAPDKSSGRRRQKIQIIWNFVGELKQDEDKQTIERQRKSRTA